MLLSLKDLTSYTIEANDGSIGQVNSFLFDDQRWVLRYLVVDTRVWLPGRHVLIPPSCMGNPDPLTNAFPVDLSREQIKNSPNIDTDKPVSRQHEIELYQHFSWLPYWHSPMEPILTPYSFSEPIPGEEVTEEDPNADPHLRSSEEVRGYHIAAKDGEIGHIEDFLVDGEKWMIRYIMIDTKNWLPGKKVIIPPKWIKEISWSASKVVVDVSRESVKNSPEFEPEKHVTREYENLLHNHYGWPVYWL